MGCTGLSSCKLTVFNGINLVVTVWFILLRRNSSGLICHIILTRENIIQTPLGQLFHLCGTAAVNGVKVNMEKLSEV